MLGTVRTSMIALLLVSLPCPVLADTGLVPSGPVDGFLRMLLALAVVLLAIFATMWLLRRLQGPATAGSRLRVVAATAVGTRERVVVVELEQTWFVLGVAPGRVERIGELPRPAGAPTSAAAPGGGFRAQIDRALGRGEGEASS